VAIVNERFARQFWPGEAAVGQTIDNGDFRPGHEKDLLRLTVIGVARDARYRWLGDQPRSFIYVPIAQREWQRVNFLLRRTSSRPPSTTLIADVRRALKQFDPNLPLTGGMPLRSYADLGLLPQRLAASVAGALGLVAVLLSAIGVYGVTAFAVARRTREIGIRMALGAGRGGVMGLVIRQTFRFTAVGSLVGLAAALGVGQLVSGLLFGVSPFDPVTFAAAALGLALVVLVASALPARRAARVDPIVALRTE